ncbi:MAG: hypothetical protein RR847_05310 [Bacilli bacterium]
MENKFLEQLKFDEKKINGLMSKINLGLKTYIENNVIEEYNLNDGGHNIDHINYVLNRSFEIVNSDINIDVLYTCVMFHDISCHIDRENHEILSAERAFNDEFLNEFFDENQMLTIKNAIEDHRASLEYEPRNIYGKILSSADRKVEVKVYLVSSMSFDIKKHPELTKEEVINGSYEFAIKKFGKNGYAINKSYISDGKYEKFLNDLQYLIESKQEYFETAGIVYDEIKGI